MKRFLPIFLMFFSFSLFLAGQIAYKSIANLVNNHDAMRQSLYTLEDSFHHSVFTTIDSDKIILNKDRTPIIILNFWAPWCSECLSEFPFLVKLQKMFPTKDLKIISISTSADNGDYQISRIIDKYKINFEIIKDESGDIFENFQIKEVPTTIVYFFGKLLEIKKGPKDFSSDSQIERFKNLINQVK